MDYKSYVKSLGGSIAQVVRAKNKGVILSRYENFDLLFKKELAISEFVRDEHNPVFNIYNNITNFDYRLARFYADAFSSLMYGVYKGYTFEGIVKEYKYLIKEAKKKSICSGKFKVISGNKNNVYNIKILNKDLFNMEYSIGNTLDLVSSSLSLISLLGSLDEEDDDFREWLGGYLYKVFDDINNNLEATPYIEKETTLKSLKSYFLDEEGDSFLGDYKEDETSNYIYN